MRWSDATAQHGPRQQADDGGSGRHDRHRDASRASLATLGAFAMLLTAACGDDSPAAQPLAPTPTSAGSAKASGSPSPSPSFSPSPSTSPAPLSPFEADPAVIALRIFSLQAALAVNAGDLGFPALNAVSTPNRQAETQRSFASDLGGYVPGPFPFTLSTCRWRPRPNDASRRARWRDGL